MNAVVPASQSRAPTRVEKFMGAVFTPADRIEVKKALPAHVPFDRFERNLSNALMNNAKLLECNPREVFREVAKIAGLGLMLDAYLGEAYLVPDYRGGVQVRIGYRGLNKLARQSGEVASIHACAVHANDPFEIVEGTERSITHTPDVFEKNGPRGDVVGYYAVVKYKDGDTDFEPMSLRQIHAIRDRSDAWKAYAAKKIKSTPWATDEGEMAKKTVFRRLMKRVPQSADLSAAQRIEDRADVIEGIAVDVTPEAVGSAETSSLPAPDDRVSADAPFDPVDPDFREVGETTPQTRSPAAPKAPTAPRAPQAPKAPTRSAEPAPIDGTDWHTEIASYGDQLGSVEDLEALVEAIDMYGARFADAPDDIRAEVTKLQDAERARVARAAS